MPKWSQLAPDNPPHLARVLGGKTYKLSNMIRRILRHIFKIYTYQYQYQCPSIITNKIIFFSVQRYFHEGRTLHNRGLSALQSETKLTNFIAVIVKPAAAFSRRFSINLKKNAFNWDGNQSENN